MIYCVEDDDAVRDLMIYTLNATGFAAKGLADGAELFAALQEEQPQLIVLDIMLPGEDGLAILRRIRNNSATAKLPVIMATAKGTEYDKVTGLDLGADDYLAKPFGMMEMVSRIKAVLRRTAPTTENTLQIGGLCLNDSAHNVSAAGEKIQLTLKEYELLRLFMQNPGLVFSREQLCKAFGAVILLAKPVR